MIVEKQNKTKKKQHKLKEKIVEKREIRGKTGVFSFNPHQAMNWLMTNKNVFTVMCHILLRKNFRKHYLVHIDLPDNEVLISTRDIKTKPLMTDNQINRALDNLCRWGFIELIDFKPIMRVAGMKRILILVDIFDPATKKIVDEYKKMGGWFPFY